MTICPIALAVHCVGCPLVKICPAKTILGDYDKYKPEEDPAKKATDDKNDRSKPPEK
jgi:hypothetical protein